ncbi:MAG: hypothetical protein KBT04_04920 [Bacteroidales bacterium]|nr:hypothetical protein [Candidatus Colimorpha onthohippi]
MNKKSIFLTVAAIALTAMIAGMTAGCKRTHEQVVEQYPDSTPMLVLELEGEGDNAVRVGEKRYYANGQLQYEKHYTAGKNRSSVASGTWRYYHANGKLFAKADFDAQHPMGDHWSFENENGEPYFAEGYDSLCVTELNELETPATIVLYRDKNEEHYQFYSNCQIRSHGTTSGGKRIGHWAFWHSNGQMQAEADFVDGEQDGTYCVYRENGVPYYRGTFDHGKRVGRWEFYDEDATLVHTKDY